MQYLCHWKVTFCPLFYFTTVVGPQVGPHVYNGTSGKAPLHSDIWDGASILILLNRHKGNKIYFYVQTLARVTSKDPFFVSRLS